MPKKKVSRHVRRIVFSAFFRPTVIIIYHFHLGVTYYLLVDWSVNVKTVKRNDAKQNATNWRVHVNWTFSKFRANHDIDGNRKGEGRYWLHNVIGLTDRS